MQFSCLCCIYIWTFDYLQSNVTKIMKIERHMDRRLCYRKPKTDFAEEL